MAKKKILICDDSEGVRESLKLIFEDSYELIFADDGFEAIVAAKKEAPDLVLMDIKMPGLNGIEAIKEIHKLNPKTKIICVSGYQYTESARQALQEGAADYIVKPFEEEDIKEVVKKVLKKD
ncbi:MAG: response regulator [Candidatus Omnitrophota bacterium]|nr:response regulator [Candidatus Omnitrophota bacterium]